MKTARIAAAVLVLSAFGTITPTTAQTTSPTTVPTSDPRFFSQTGFRIDTDAFWTFFQQRGGVRTFGYPVSRSFALDGFQIPARLRDPGGTHISANDGLVASKGTNSPRSNQGGESPVACLVARPVGPRSL